jgi:2-polyprenyl-3-methyl-5-hydroxy-6-metoxy-1,4-benzoquinol methylase
MAIEAVRDLLMRLETSTRALAALGLALDERVQGVPLDPAIRTEIDHVLAALGARDMLEGVTATELTPLLAEIRMTLLLNTQLLLSPARTGWTHTDGEILQSIGEFSATFPQALKQTLPRLEGLAQRLESPDGALLDVGVGVGAMAIAMAREWPRLRVVGIDPWRPSLAIARANVQTAGLDARIELREQVAQELSDTRAFDLAFFPSFFIAEAVIRAALVHVYQALRPGGWIEFAIQNPGPDSLTAALARLRTVLWGGRPWTADEAESLLRQAGYTQVQTLPSWPTAPGVRIIGRRPLEEAGT